jgi:hypothetical protein
VLLNYLSTIRGAVQPKLSGVYSGAQWVSTAADVEQRHLAVVNCYVIMIFRQCHQHGPASLWRKDRPNSHANAGSEAHERTIFSVCDRLVVRR